jgi:hypothetical protein
MPVAAAPSPTFAESSRPAQPQVAEEAQRTLKESPYFALRTLRVDYHEGILTVRGRVPTFYARQVAVETLRRMKSVEQLVDRIEVE